MRVLLQVHHVFNFFVECYRLWELLTFGAVAVIERGVGFDKTVSYACVSVLFSQLLLMRFLQMLITSCFSSHYSVSFSNILLSVQVWRLPVLLVDDFADVTPLLLRTAYVEAVYRAEGHEFEFQRLTQSWWFSFIMRVARAQTTDAVLESFPLEAEDPTFTRPAVPFVCEEKDGKSNCGEGTKRTPRNSCL